jgi:hypothetical protein
MATSIVPELIYLYIPLGLVSLWKLIKCLDINPFEEGEGLGERRGSLDERHRERVRTKMLSAPFAPTPGSDISSSMEQKFIKTRVMI